MKNNLHALFDPENIAVIGASSNPMKAGCIILSNLIRIGYPKKVFPVSVNEESILDFPCYKKLSEVEDTVELVVLITPSELIYDIMKDLDRRMAVKNDVKVIVCAAANYGETRTEEGRRRQACLIDTARKYGIRVLGPNCIGVIDNINRVDTTFVETLLPSETRGKKGGISFISQSGSIAAAILMKGASQPAPISINKFVSIGNMADVDFIDLLEYFEQDEDTRVIGMYMEGCADGKKLIETMARIARKKPIVVLKVGRSEVGAAAANSHTGSLAGADEVYSAAFRQFGVIRTYNMQELIDNLQAFDSLPLPESNRVFILSQTGGFGIYSTDALLEQKTLQMPVVSAETKERLRSLLPEMASICSPEGYADITASATVRQHVDALRAVLDDERVDSVIFLTVVPSFLPQKELAEELIRFLKEEDQSGKPVYVSVLAGNYVWGCRALLESGGIKTFDEPANAVSAVKNMTEYGMFLSDLKGGEAFGQISE